MIAYNRECTFGGYRLRYVEDVTDGLRFVGYSDQLLRLAHKGWYADDEELYRGVVYALPSKGSKRRLVAGYADPFNEGAVSLDLSCTMSDEVEAARDADNIAERCAELSREYEEASSARCHHDELQAGITREFGLIASYRETHRKVIHTFAPMQRALRGEVYAVLADKVHSAIEVIRENRRTMQSLEDDFSHAEGWKVHDIDWR